jgi:hypothetical protein
MKTRFEIEEELLMKEERISLWEEYGIVPNREVEI